MFGGNKIIRFIFAFAIVLLLSISSCAASSVSLEPSSQIVSAGETFTVDVFVEPHVEIAGMQFNLKFDNTKIHVNEVIEGDLFKQSGISTYFNSGTVEFDLLRNVYGAILGPANVAMPSTFATITMIVDSYDAGISTIKLENIVISDPEGNSVEIEITNAFIEIVDKRDVNGDGIINFEDSKIVIKHFSEITHSPYPSWDVNSDGVVNILDLLKIRHI